MVNIHGNIIAADSDKKDVISTIQTIAEYETKLKQNVYKSYHEKSWRSMFAADDEMSVHLSVLPGDSLKVYVTIIGQYIESRHIGDFVRVRVLDLFNNEIFPPQQARYMLIAGDEKIAGLSHGCQNILIPDSHKPENEIRVYLEVNVTSTATRTWWDHSCGIQVTHTRKVMI